MDVSRETEIMEVSPNINEPLKFKIRKVRKNNNIKFNKQIENIANLPNYETVTRIPEESNKKYNTLEAKVFVECIEKTYEETIKWKKNLFKLPTGQSGKKIIKELTEWLDEFNSGGEMKFIAIKTFMILPNLLMQKPSKTSKAKEHSEKLEERFRLWKEGKIEELIRDGKNVQKNMVTSKNQNQLKTYREPLPN